MYTYRHNLEDEWDVCFKFVFIGANSKVKQRNTMSAQRPACNHVSHQAKVATTFLSVHTCLIESVSIAHTHMHARIAHTHAHAHTQNTRTPQLWDTW